MSRYVTFHPVGHEPADSIVLAGVLRAVAAVHEWPLLVDQHDDDIVAAVAQHGPATASVLARHLEVRSVGGFTRQLRRIASTGRIELANGGTWRVPQAAATNGTGAAVVPAKPGGGVTVGPVERRPFDPEAARLRAAGEL